MSQLDQLDFAQRPENYDQRIGFPLPPDNQFAGPGAPPQPTVYQGDASYYDLPGNKTASGAQFDPNASAGAMTADKARLGAQVTVEYTARTPNCGIRSS